MSVFSDEEVYTLSSSDGYDSEQISSDLENELYSQIYHTSNLECSQFLEKDNNDVSIVNGKVRSNSVLSPSIQNDVKKSDRNIDCSIEPNKNIRKFQRNSPLRFTQSTPKIPPNIRTNNNGCTSNKSVHHKLQYLNEHPQYFNEDSESESDCDDGVLFLDSWDSNNNNVVTNMQRSESDQHSEEFDACRIDQSYECSSSSSSVVVLDDVKTPNKNFTPITIDSDSSSDSSSGPENYFSQSLPIELEKNIGKSDLWRIDIEDSIRPSKSKRYFRKSESNCRICRGFGHMADSCPKQIKKCFLCGGSHTSFKCKNKVCGICFKTGHSRNFCGLNSHDFYCKNCHLYGHLKQRCPDIWRKYSFTASESEIKEPSENTVKTKGKYCYNCGAQGHLGFSCSNPRFIRSSLPTSPFIISKKLQGQNFVKHFNNMPAQNHSSLVTKNQTLPFISPIGKMRKKKKLKKKLSNEEPSFIRTPEKSTSTENKLIKKRKKFLKWKAMQKSKFETHG